MITGNFVTRAADALAASPQLPRHVVAHAADVLGTSPQLRAAVNEIDYLSGETSRAIKLMEAGGRSKEELGFGAVTAQRLRAVLRPAVDPKAAKLVEDVATSYDPARRGGSTTMSLDAYRGAVKSLAKVREILLEQPANSARLLFQRPAPAS